MDSTVIAQLILGLFTLLGVLVSSFFAMLGARNSKIGAVQAQAANKAVNSTGEEGHRIYELATQNHFAIHDVQKMAKAIQDELRAHVALEDSVLAKLDATLPDQDADA